MKRLVGAVAGSVLLLGALYWGISRHRASILSAQIQEEVKRFSDLPKKTLKIKLQMDAKPLTFSRFRARVAEGLESAGFVSPGRGESSLDAELDANVTVAVWSGTHVPQSSGEASTRYTGAALSGTIELRTPKGGSFKRLSDAEKPLETTIYGGHENPSDAPVFEIYWKHKMPRIIDLVGEAYGPEPLIRAVRSGKGVIRGLYAKALIRLGKPGAGPLAGALESRQPLVGVATAFTLGQIGDPAAVAPLTRYLAADEDDSRFAVAPALAKLGDPRGMETLSRSLPS